MSALEARLLTEADYEQWDQLAEQSECGTIFHSSLWITTSARCLGLKVVMIGVFKGDHLVGGCFFYKRRILSLLPVGTTRIELSPYGGFLLPNIALSKVRANEGKRRTIVSTILDNIEKEKLLSLTITNSPNLIDLREFILKNWTVTVHYTYMIPLEGDISSNVDRVVRDSIRKAQKHGIVVAKENEPTGFLEIKCVNFHETRQEYSFSARPSF